MDYTFLVWDMVRMLGNMAGQPHIVMVLVRNSTCKVVELLASKKVEGIFRNVKVGETVSSHLIQLSGRLELSEVNRLGLEAYLIGRSFLWVDAPSCKACKIFSRTPTIPRSIIYLKGVGVVFSFLTPGQIATKKIIAMLRDAGLDVEVLNKSVLDLKRMLTRRQTEVLLAAVEMNYFNEPRQVSLADIAERLGLAKSTISRHLRAAMKKLAIDQSLRPIG
ncbi:MAG: helix-turn-helix domain-containing protein [Nitrososphaerota archaeon]